jgi:hypothetical protein
MELTRNALLLTGVPLQISLYSCVVAVLSIVLEVTDCVVYNSASAQNGAYFSAVKYCSKYEKEIHLADDKSVLCFDGKIESTIKMDIIRNLKDGGLFVMRSGGGDVATAIEMADVLKEKDAVVILYGYCLSSCANYIFVASNRTYVSRMTIVGWHGGPRRLNCGDYDFRLDNTSGINEQPVLCEKLNKATEMHKFFFKERSLDDRHIYHPQTEYTKRLFKVVKNSYGGHRNIFWMWNPSHHQSYFGSRIIYEEYPEDQSTVDQIVRASALAIRVIYDPN